MVCEGNIILHIAWDYGGSVMICPVVLKGKEETPRDHGIKAPWPGGRRITHPIGLYIGCLVRVGSKGSPFDLGIPVVAPSQNLALVVTGERKRAPG